MSGRRVLCLTTAIMLFAMSGCALKDRLDGKGGSGEKWKRQP
jgi:hypothetical protein